MKLKPYLAALYLPMLLFICCSGNEEVSPVIDPPVVEQPKDLAERLRTTEWETKKLSEAIVWKYYHFDDLFSSNQSVTVFDVDLNANEVHTDISFVTSGFLKTSEAGKATRATIAINGSYFDTKVGGSTVFLKEDGKIINATKSGFTPYRENAAFMIDDKGAISIIAKPSAGWASVEAAQTLLAGGPLLISADKVVEQVDAAFNTNRHPRTAVGVTADNHLIAVVVDGRTSEAYGMTIAEIASVMEALGCEDAMNLDGGGSSTAFVRNRGVVNYPCDNKQFDHEGERAVATVIVFTEG